MPTKPQEVDDDIANELDQLNTEVEDGDEFEVVVADEQSSDEEVDEGEPPLSENEDEENEEAPPTPDEEETEAEPVAAAAADALDPDLEGDEEYKAFAPKIQKRIQREIRIRRQAEHAANTAVTKLQEVAQVAASERAAAQQARNSNNEMQRQYAEVLVHAFGTQIDLKQRELKDARAAGEFETEQKIQSELDDLRFKHNQVKDMQRSIPAASTEEAAPSSTPAPAQTPAPAPAPRNPLVEKWVRDNSSWFNNPKFDAHREFVLKLDRKVALDGYDKKTKEYYAELDRRIDKAFPTLRRKPNMKKEKSNTGPVSAVSSGTTSTPASRIKKVVLKQADLENMRQFGLDPQNKAHLREYATNIRDIKE